MLKMPLNTQRLIQRVYAAARVKEAGLDHRSDQSSQNFPENSAAT